MLRLIGRGSYGEVWLALNFMGTLRAVKVVRRSEFKEERPFIRELSGIQKYEPVSRAHEGLVDLLQVGRNEEEGFYYAVMELADAMHGDRIEEYEPKTLTNVLKERGRLTASECLPLFQSLASALAFLHERGLVHRDVKPSNIIFVNGAAKLADIGLVAAESDAASYVGTEGFIPPEGPGTRLADIYALGKVFYEAATGLDRTEFPTLPLKPEEFESNRDLLELNAIIVKACESQPADRYQSAAELHADLALLQSGKSVKDMRLVEARLSRARRAGAMILVAAVMALIFLQFFRHRAAVANANFAKAEQLRLRAERAESKAREELWHARIAEAQALRQGGLAGRRFAALHALTNAAAVKVDASVRSEVAACFCLPDVQPLALGRSFEPHRQIVCWNNTLDRYAEGFTNGQVVIRRASEHTVLQTIQGPPHPGLDSLELSPREKCLFLQYNDGSRSFWKLDQQAPRAGWPAPTEGGGHAFSSDDRYLALVLTNDMVAVFEIGSDRLLREMKTGIDPVDLRMSPARPFLAVQAGEDEKIVEVWNWEKGQLAHRLENPVGVHSIAWSVNGRLLAVATRDFRIHIWDTLKWEEKQTLFGHQGHIFEMAFLPEVGLLSTSWDGSTRLWNLQSGFALWRLTQSGPNVHFNPETRRIGFQGADASQLALFELAPETVARNIPRSAAGDDLGPLGGCFSPDGKYVAGTLEQGAKVWDAITGALVTEIQHADLHDFVFDPKDDSLLVAGVSGLARRREIQGEPIRFGEPESFAPGPALYLRLATNGAFAWFDRSRVHVRHPEGSEVVWIPKHPGLEALALSPDGRWVASGTRNRRGVKLWDAHSGAFIREHPAEFGGFVAFSPDSRWLASGSSEEYALWDVKSGVSIWKLPRHHAGGLTGRIAFSPDGKTLAVADSRSVIKLVVSASGEEIIHLEHPIPQIISHLTFNSAGDKLAAFCESRVVQLWDLRRLRQDLAALKMDWPDPN